MSLGIDKMVKVSLRTITLDVPVQYVITKDNVSVKINTVVYFRVIDPKKGYKTVINVEKYFYATLQFAQIILRSVCGKVEFDKFLAER